VVSPPSPAGDPRHADSQGDATDPTQYATDVWRLLTRVAGTADHRDAIRERVHEFSNELTVRALDEAVDLFVRSASELGMNEPTLADELRRWRRSLETAAEGLGAMENAITEQAERRVEEELELPDLRTLELPARESPGRGKSVGRDLSPDLGP
jgi:hypothetical protein